MRQASLCVAAWLLSSASPVWAQGEPDVEPSDGPPAESAPAPAPATAAADPGAPTEAPAGGLDAPPAPATQADRGEAMVVLLRGFYLGVAAGVGLLALPEDDVRHLPSGALGLSLGGDLGELISLQLLVSFSAFGEQQGQPIRDLVMMAARLGLLFTAWHSEQLWLQLGLGGGLALTDDGLSSEFVQRPSGHALVSLQYYTDMRHFSIGLDLDVQVLLSPVNANIQLLPHVRYTF